MYNFRPELHVKYISKLSEHPGQCHASINCMRFSQFELMTDIHISPFHWQIKLHFYIIFILEYLFFQYPSRGQYTVHLKHLNNPGTWGHLQLPSDSKFLACLHLILLAWFQVIS